MYGYMYICTDYTEMMPHSLNSFHHQSSNDAVAFGNILPAAAVQSHDDE